VFQPPGKADAWKKMAWQDKAWAKFSTLEPAGCMQEHNLCFVAKQPSLLLTQRLIHFLGLSPIRNVTHQLVLIMI
jgi:hypothetical protein